MKVLNRKAVFLVIISIGLVAISVNAIQATSEKIVPPQSLVSKYKDLKNPFGRHSLFTGSNGTNVSKSFRAVPPPIPDAIPKTPVFEEPEKVVAKRLVELYRKQFDFIDAIVVDDLITAEELAEVYRVYEWPKELTDIADEVAYSKTIIDKYDKDNKGGMNFVDFCLYSEDLWDISDSIQEQKCSSGFEKANEIWSNFFKWLDRDNDGYLVMEDCIFGISKMMYRDADMDEIQKTFAEYGGADKKLNFDSFVLAIANGFLDKSLKDPNFTETLME